MEITDSWAAIIANVANGTYHKYKLGNYKPIDLGTSGIVNMQIVAMDADDLADGTGKAPLTFISKELLKGNGSSYNPNVQVDPNDPTKYVEGTGVIGGWEKSSLRNTLRTTIKSRIPSNVRSAIKNVTKYSRIMDTSGVIVNDIASTDDVWIPSVHEIRNVVNSETMGATYWTAFPDYDSCIKAAPGGSAEKWWLRTAESNSNKRTEIAIPANGDLGTDLTNNLLKYPLGFCL